MNKNNCLIGLQPAQGSQDSDENISPPESITLSDDQSSLAIQNGPLLWTGDWDHSNQV